MTLLLARIAAAHRGGAVVNPDHFIALPLTYDEQDYAGAMTWVRQGNGPLVTPQGFEGDGYSSRLMSTTIPTWMQAASAPLTLHASVSFYPVQLASSSANAIYIGPTTSASKLQIEIDRDASNNKTTQAVLYGKINSTTFAKKLMGRAEWRYAGRSPDTSVSGFLARPQAIGFIDSDTLLLSCHFQDHFSRIYKIRVSDWTVLGSFDSTDYPHVANCAQRANGDWWFGLNDGRMGLVDLDACFASGTLALSAYSELPDSGAGGICFVTVGGTEYLVEHQYATTGSAYIWVFPASLLGNATIVAADRYKRFDGGPQGVQGLAMRDGKLLVSSVYTPGTATAGGFISRFDIVTAISSLSDGATITAERIDNSPAIGAEDIAVHPTTDEVWAPIEQIGTDTTSPSSMTVWASPLDGNPVENHYTIEYDGSGTTTIRINNRVYDTMSGTFINNVGCIVIGGAPDISPGFTTRYFTGFVRNVVLQDEPMTTAQYNAAISGAYEPNHLTAYEFTLTNPGAEAGSTTGWTAESGAVFALSYSGGGTNTLPHGGDWIFTGGNSATSISRQRLDVLAQTGLTGTQVDAGSIWAKVRWWQANADASDSGAMGLRMLDETSTSTGEAYAGVAIMPNVSGTYRPWYPRAFSANLPSGTRYIDALAKMVRPSGTANDSQIDDVRVTVYRQ